MVLVVGDKSAIEQLRIRIKGTLDFQARVKANAELAAKEKENRERQERPT